MTLLPRACPCRIIVRPARSRCCCLLLLLLLCLLLQLQLLCRLLLRCQSMTQPRDPCMRLMECAVAACIRDRTDTRTGSVAVACHLL